MRIGIDLDGTFCTDRYKSGGILNCKLMGSARDAIWYMRHKGHEVIFFTHRSEKMSGLTVQWLKDNEIEYDDIIFDKPHFDLYIGDEAEKFVNWGFVMAKL